MRANILKAETTAAETTTSPNTNDAVLSVGQHTEAYDVGVGVEPDNFGLVGQGRLRPDLNGQRFKVSRSDSTPEVYLIDRGYRRQVPNPETYNNLFRSWNDIQYDINILEVPPGDPAQISNRAVLVRALREPLNRLTQDPDPVEPAYVWLVEFGVKRLISSPAVMDKYSFRWDRVYRVPSICVESIPRGADITMVE